MKINIFRGDLNDISAKPATLVCISQIIQEVTQTIHMFNGEAFFEIKFNVFFGYFDPQFFFCDNKNQ